MAFMESNEFVTLGEYMDCERSRVHFSDLEEGQLYTAMFRLESKITPAARIATRLVEVVRYSGSTAVSFAFLDDSLQGTQTKLAIFNSGYMTNFDGGLNLYSRDESGIETPAAYALEGYFRDYFDNFYDYLGVNKAELDLRKTLSV